MIEIQGISKKFEDILAVDNVSFTVPEGEFFGLVGTNGAGKSTLLRMLSGVMRPDQGTILIDGEEIFDHPEVRKKICFLADTWVLPVNADAAGMAEQYRVYYPDFRMDRFHELMGLADLDEKRKLRTFSKGMKKQVFVILGICTETKYLFGDEIFDGLDPVMRQSIKTLFAMEMLDRQFTPVIASHSLRELEDMCDQVGLLHRGGILFSENLEEKKFHLQKVQCVLKDHLKEESLLKELEVIRHQKIGSMLTFVARGTKVEIMEAVQRRQPVFAEVLPLSLEEIFISETEVAGYDIKDFFLH